MPKQIPSNYNPNYDFSNFTFSASSLGKIMTEPREKSPMQKYQEALDLYTESVEKLKTSPEGTKATKNLEAKCDKLKKEVAELEKQKDDIHLSSTCISHLSEIYTTFTKGRRRFLSTKYMDKGKQGEEDGITEVSIVDNIFHKKNTIRITKDSFPEREATNYIEGECDIDDEDNDMITDTKCSWDVFTFDEVVNSGSINSDYLWQQKAYCWLYGRSKARIAYVLLSTPEKLVEFELSRLKNAWFLSEKEMELAVSDIRRLHDVSDIPVEDRVHFKYVEFTEEDKHRIIKRVNECRKFLCNYKELMKKR